MRDLRALDHCRDRSRAVIDLWGWTGDERCGAFNIPSPIDGGTLRVIASNDEGWDHVSVSRRNRCPNWIEMQHVFKLFFKDDEDAMQLHVPATDHINDHPYCLHIWRPHFCNLPRPPAEFVGNVRKKETA